MLTVDRIDLFYGAAQALRSVSIKAETGRILTVLGRNGVGKSSLLRAIVGQHMVASGAIRWNDEDMTRLPSHLRAKAGFGYVPQGREIFPLLTVRENLMTGFAALQALRARDRRRDLFALSRPQRHARTPRRRPLGRPAAAARHRPRAGDEAEAPRSSTSRPRASSPRSSRTSAGRSCTCGARATWRSWWSSNISNGRATSATTMR